jgi:choline dehydrogenase
MKSLSLSLSALLLSTGSALVSATPAAQSAVTANVQDVASQTWDYIILGGGLTGLTVANRLSENSTVKVLVVEAGNGGLLASFTVPYISELFL